MGAPRGNPHSLIKPGRLSGVIGDLFVALAKAAAVLPGGPIGVVEDAWRAVARTCLEGFLAENTGACPITDPVRALHCYLANCESAGLGDPEAAIITETPDGHIGVTFPAEACIYRPHCDLLAREGLPRICPLRLFSQQAVSRITARSMTSAMIPGPSEGDCAFEIFPAPDDPSQPAKAPPLVPAAASGESGPAGKPPEPIGAQHRLILETIADAIVVVDSSRTVTYINPRACGVFAIRTQEAVGRRLETDSVFGRIGDLCIRAVRNLGGWEGETTIENRDDGKIHNIYHARFSPIVSADFTPGGTLIVLEDVTREQLLRRELASLAERLEVAVREKTHELRTANAKLAVLARTDSLTGLANRRMFEEILNKELKRASRHHHPIGIVVIDIDDFKKVNDRLGHQKGDEVLILVAGLLLKSVRESDTVARWGGDEFIILLPQATARECRAVSKRIRKNILIERADIELENGPAVDLSVGWASSTAGDVTTTIAAADDMMYDEKAQKKAGVGRTKH
ncbi:MAG: diguanylate cyclase [Planctomycetes bacterium]|nr:diguanylate cyclase [Planctomycetota bacterium]